MKGIGRWFRHIRGLALSRARGDVASALRHRRELALLAIDGDAETISFTRDGLSWTTRAVRHTITRNLYVHGRHPHEEFAALADWLRARRQLVPERPWCVDVGANVGAPTLFFARDMGRRVIAIEPVVANLTLLRRNAKTNGLSDRIRVVYAAVADQDGEIDVMHAVRDGESEVAADGVAGIECVTVRGRRLDGILAAEGVDVGEVAFVWSDTQGYETQVIRSAPSLWKAGVPVFIEVWPAALDRHGGLAAFLATVREHFRQFVPARVLIEGRAEAEPLPIAEFEGWVRGLVKQTDALLVP